MTPSSVRQASIALGLAMTVGVRSLDAQLPANPDTATPPAKPLFTADDAWLGAGFAGLTIAMFPIDRAVARRLQGGSSSENRFIERMATGSEVLASPGAMILGTGLWLTGRLTHRRTMADVGLHGTEAIILGAVINKTLKNVLGRERPYASGGTEPRDFRLGTGFGSEDRQSFPSGHTTTAFAAAAAFTSEVKRVWPTYTWIAGPVLYGGATMVGLARMYHNKHWASDVALGAAIGTFSGIKVVRYSHHHPDNIVDRHLLRVIFAPNAQGGGFIGLSVW